MAFSVLISAALAEMLEPNASEIPTVRKNFSALETTAPKVFALHPRAPMGAWIVNARLRKSVKKAGFADEILVTKGA